MQPEGSTTLKRRLAIVDLVRKDGEARVEDLSSKLGVSSVTIRSDLNYLEGQGYVIRAFGKAKYNPALQGAAAAPLEPDPSNRAAAEAQLARAVLPWVENGMSVFLSAGGIASRVLPSLVSFQGLALTMHDLDMVTIAKQFLPSEIYVTGGLHSADEPGLSGPGAELGLLSRPIDLCVIVVTGVDTRGRLVTRHPGAARLYSAAVRHAKRSIAAAYSPSFSAIEGHPICSLGDLDGLALNHNLEPAVFDLVSEHQLRVHRKGDGIIEFVRA
ncbi:MAG: DeoR/GlpR transcriptional regulator [Proteobacteria bacterium]|nr:DeoR/GlpR transcriptional regulator [Pseudomonadota bacterium]